MSSVRVIGGGRAGCSIHNALVAAGWSSAGVLGREDSWAGAAHGVDLLVLATPDEVLAEVAAAVVPVDGTVVAHLSGANGLDVLVDHQARGLVHPLVTLPNPEIGAGRLRGAWFAVAGEPPAINLIWQVVADLRGQAVVVAAKNRAVYHATAVVASNHLVALMGQVERLAEMTGVPMEAYLDLAAGALDDVRSMGSVAALTGPAARGDERTIATHLDALPATERVTYSALAAEARRLIRESGT
ncbi:MAG: DUF2520 domain-containing protein [Acidimicrobiales bacterium]|nr:DUF2520 domain-containing protein [Acidimicrobiales bacterium]